MKPCPICQEEHEAGRTLNYDGKGINSCGEYRYRIATFTTAAPENQDALGRLFSAAPEMLAALADLLEYCNGKLDRNPYTIPQYKAGLAAVRKAIGADYDVLDSLQEYRKAKGE